MSGILDRIREVATIEEIEAEQSKLRLDLVSTQQKIDAFEVYRRVLVIARDGKPERQPRGPRKGKAEKASESLASQDEIPESTAAGHARANEKTTVEYSIKGDSPSHGTTARLINALEQFGGLTIGELSRTIKTPYGTVYSALNRDSRFTKSGDRWYVKRK